MIKTLIYNWRATNTGREIFNTRTIGELGCKEIKTHYSQGEGDKWYADIYYDDGSVETIFNPNYIYSEKEKEL